MKQLLICMLLFTAATLANAQDSWKPTIAYCEIVGTGNLTGTKVKIEIDFGQKNNYWSGYNDKFLVDEEGNKLKFNSMVDAMNFMSQLGWHFEQAYVVTDVSGMGKQNVYHYLLSKELTGSEKINAGIRTKQDLKEELEEQVIQEPKEKKGFFNKNAGDDVYN